MGSPVCTIQYTAAYLLAFTPSPSGLTALRLDFDDPPKAYQLLRFHQLDDGSISHTVHELYVPPDIEPSSFTVLFDDYLGVLFILATHSRNFQTLYRLSYA